MIRALVLGLGLWILSLGSCGIPAHGMNHAIGRDWAEVPKSFFIPSGFRITGNKLWHQNRHSGAVEGLKPENVNRKNSDIRHESGDPTFLISFRKLCECPLGICDRPHGSRPACGDITNVFPWNATCAANHGSPWKFRSAAKEFELWDKVDELGGRLAGVFDRQFKAQSFIGSDGTRPINRYIRPNLSLTNFAGFFGHLLGGQQSSPNEDHTNTSDNSHNGRYYEHPLGPKRHVRLSYKVILGAFGFICGLYYAAYAFYLGNTVKPETSAAYLILGMMGIGAGMFFMLTYGYTY